MRHRDRYSVPDESELSVTNELVRYSITHRLKNSLHNPGHVEARHGREDEHCDCSSVIYNTCRRFNSGDGSREDCLGRIGNMMFYNSAINPRIQSRFVPTSSKLPGH